MKNTYLYLRNLIGQTVTAMVQEKLEEPLGNVCACPPTNFSACLLFHVFCYPPPPPPSPQCVYVFLQALHVPGESTGSGDLPGHPRRHGEERND